MKFKVLKSKRNIALEVIDGFGGFKTVLIALLAICNVFTYVKTGYEVVYYIAVSIMSMFIWYKIEKDYWNELISNSSELHMTIVTIVGFIASFIFCRYAYYHENFIVTTSPVAWQCICLFIAGMAVEFTSFIMVSAIFGIYSLVKIILTCAYENCMKHVLIARFPGSKEELMECGVHNRIECAMYYLVMQKGFNTKRKKCLFNLKELGLERFSKLTDIFYSFNFSADECVILSEGIMKFGNMEDAANNLLSDLIPDRNGIIKHADADYKNHLERILEKRTYGSYQTEELLIKLNEIVTEKA
ncbi:hypothetical protein DW886_15740 [Enterocloster aldenensis]|uniref:hypothetical protein n=1 Tax=Enterocloster aldenensis TaxID=358742 RepID=UPI000E4839D1|nr:hypothetical protein DW886_15740 [Enterocloster aldenensis]